jgi:hypothetical protein
MIEMVKIVELKALDGHRLFVRFSDGDEGVADLRWMLEEAGPMLQPLKDPQFFRQAFISCGVPAWPNGYDIDAINLHLRMREAGELKRPALAK